MKTTLSLLLMFALLISLFAGMGVLAAEETVAAALEIYTQTEGGEPALAKAYTAEELAALAETAEANVYPFYKKDTLNAVVATEYVSLSALLADAGVSFGEGDSLAFTCADGLYTKGDFSYANISPRGLDAEGAAVPTALAIKWANGSLEGGAAALAAEASDASGLRFVCGATAEELEAQNAAGNRMPSGVVEITVVGKPSVRPSNHGLKVDGEEKNTDVYTISDKNYFKLRDIAMLLSGTAAQFSVSFDAETHTVFITTGEAYTPVGGELETGVDRSESCKLSNWTIEVNGEKQDIVAYNIGNNNYFQLRQLGDALGFGVDWDPVARTMLITSGK